MSHLTICFEREDLPDYKLPCRPDASADKIDYTFELLGAKLLHKGETFNVYRGTLQRSDNMSTAAVVKLGWRDSHPDAQDSLIHEYTLYNGRLRKLQNKSVPLCHGLFQGKTEHGFVTGLLLQDLGGHEDKDKYWADYSPDEKLCLLDVVCRLHEAGVRHNDLTESNTIFYKNRWAIVDFKEANKHKCRSDLEIEEGAVRPSEADFGCSEVWNLAMDLGVWRTGFVRLYGAWIPEDLIDTRQDLVGFAVRLGFNPSADRPHVIEAIDKIWAYLTAIRSREDQCQPREYWYYLGED